MHRHRIRAFVTTTGETDVPIAIFAEGQFLRFVGGAVRTFGLGPGTTTINALATWGDTTGTQLLNTSVLLDNAGNMTSLVTLDGQDAPNITAKTGTDPAVGEITVWASASAPWKLGRRVVTVNPAGDVTNVNTLNGRAPGILVGRSPTSTPAATSVMVHKDTTGIVSDATPVLIDSSGNLTGVGTINGTTPGTWVQGPASATDNTLATYNGTTGKIIKSATSITASGTQLREMTLFNSIGVSEHGLGGSLPTDKLTSINSITLDTTTISNVTALDGVDPLTWVVGPSSVTANRVATFNGTTGKLIQQSPVAIDGSGNVTSVTTINTVDPATWVVGPASATSTRIAIFNGTTGKLIQQSSITASGGALASVSTINTIDPATWVVGPASATSGALTTFSGTTGKLIQSATTITASGTTLANVSALNSITVGSTTLAGVTTLNSVDPSNWVVGPASATDNAVARFDTTTGKLIQNSAVIIDDSGNVSGVGTLNGLTLTELLKGSFSFFGVSSIVPGLGFTKRAASYSAGFVAYVPLSFGDTAAVLSLSMSTPDNDGVWQCHMPNASSAYTLGTSISWSNGGLWPSGSFIFTAALTVPAGSGTHTLSVTINTTSGTAPTMGFGWQMWLA